MSSSTESEVWDDRKNKDLAEMKAEHTYGAEGLDSAVNCFSLKDAHYADDKELRKDDITQYVQDNFKHSTLYYRKPNEYWNEVGLLVPNKRIDPNCTTPVHVFFMGGGFWTGDWESFFWYLKESLIQANENGAVILAVNYPRMPLADKEDITRAVKDFWSYFYSDYITNDCQREFAGLKFDLTRVMVSGESAGGYVSAESIIHAHPQLEVRALLLRYPMLRHYKRSDAHESELPYMGRPQIKNDVQKFVQPLWDKTQEIRQKMKDRGLIDAAKGIFADILDRRSPPRGMNGAFLTSWFGTWSGFFGRSKLDILTELEQANAKGESVGPRDPPALFIYHGTEDGNVPLEVSTTFVREYERMLKSKNLAGKVPVVFKTIKRGHGFDYEFKGNEVFDDETTFKEFMDHLLKVWLRKG